MFGLIIASSSMTVVADAPVAKPNVALNGTVVSAIFIS
jgi:hypothetical protein